MRSFYRGVSAKQVGGNPQYCDRFAQQRTDPADPLVPPIGINYNFAGTETDYETLYKRDPCLKHIPFLMENAGLTPESAVLDFGCGMGAHAFACSKLFTSGQYFGHDINPEGIAFLAKAYGALPNFRFNCAQVARSEDYVALALDQERTSAATADAVDLHSFVTAPLDVQWSWSTFTHMWPEAILHVLRQIGSMMRPDGLCSNSWLMLDRFAEYSLRCGLADRALPHQVRGAYTYSLENPLVCTAYEEAMVRDIYAQSSHEIVGIFPGSWSGRPGNGAYYQDIVISRPKR